MLKKIIVLLLIMLTCNLFSDVPEKYITIEIQSQSDISQITKLVSIDKREGNIIYAYALPGELEELNKLGISYKIKNLPIDERATLTMATDISQMSNWDRYPTYEVYLEMMNDFAIDYPEICSLQNIGYSQNNREIPLVKITSNVNQDAAKPGFYYSGQMHGDEVVCYILLLRLIDELLSNYGSDPEITDLINTTEIWINPLSNPDGTYYGGNSTVSGARRYLANNLDANRNFIDFIDGYPGTGSSTTVSQENLDQIAFMTGKGIVMSANTHSGEEVVNYPWDTIAGLHPDDVWYQEVSRVYADAVHENSPSSYMDGYDNGITNGYAWYEANGSRQDYANYYLGIRELTIEQSLVKLLDVSELNNHWSYNRDALIALIQEVHKGITGTISDYEGNPLVATIEILNHDTEVTKVKSNADFGDYYRPISAGIYDVRISVEGYEAQVFNEIEVPVQGNIVLDAVFGSPDYQQNINLANGWNLISYNLDVENSSPSSIFFPVLANIEEVKNMTEIYSPINPFYFNTLENIIPEEGYWVKTNMDCELELSGDAYDVTRSIDLNSGWNLIGYLPQTPVSPQIALNGIVDNLLQIKDLTSIYNPSVPDVFNTLSQLSPNKGYWIEVSQECTLIYNTSSPASIRNEEELPWQVSLHPNNSSVVYLEFISNQIDVDFENDYIGLFFEDQCVALSKLRAYENKIIAVLVAQMPSPQVTLDFYYYQANTNQSLDLAEDILVETGHVYGQAPDDLFLVNYSITDNFFNDVAGNPLNLEVENNPFRNELLVSVQGGKYKDVEIELFNLKGQKVDSRNLLINGSEKADMTFHTGNIASGVYFVRAKSCGKTSTIKVMKMK